MTVSWEEVIQAVESERQYQQLLAPEQIENPLSIGEEIALLHKYLAQTLEAWSNDFTHPELEALEGMRKIAGIAMRCMENHGAIQRSSLQMHAAEVKARRGEQTLLEKTLDAPRLSRLALKDRPNRGENIVGQP